VLAPEVLVLPPVGDVLPPMAMVGFVTSLPPVVVVLPLPAVLVLVPPVPLPFPPIAALVLLVVVLAAPPMSKLLPLLEQAKDPTHASAAENETIKPMSERRPELSVSMCGSLGLTRLFTAAAKGRCFRL
jgi:hypothetical protein